MGRVIAIGDIHGCDRALELLLAMIAPQSDDCLVVLGDVVDRGPNTRRCIAMLLELRQRCRLVHLMGNHEEMVLDALHGGEWSRSWPGYGGREMLASYGGGFGMIPPEHMDFIRGGKEYFETPTHIFVHAHLRRHVPIEAERCEYLRWERFEAYPEAHCSGKRVVCGHTAQRHGRPAGNQHYLCIDTCVYCPLGFLSALDVTTDLLWQASQAGETRPARSVWEA